MEKMYFASHLWNAFLNGEELWWHGGEELGHIISVVKKHKLMGAYA